MFIIERLKRLILIGTVPILLLIGTVPIFGGNGISGFEFLRLPESSKAVSMGNSYTAYSNDSLSLFYNPAGLSEVRWKEAVLSYSAYFMDNYYGLLVFALPIDKKSTIGIGVKYFSAGEFKIRNDTLDSIGTFNPLAFSLILGYGRSIAELSAGVNIKIFQETIYKKSELSFGTDFGVKKVFNLNEIKITGGLSIQNIGLESGDSVKSPAPLQGIAGVKIGLLEETLNILGEGKYLVPEAEMKISAGLEYAVSEYFSIRAGYKISENGNFSDNITGGFGLQYSQKLDFFIDYGFSNYGFIGYLNQVSFGIRF